MSPMLLHKLRCVRLVPGLVTLFLFGCGEQQHPDDYPVSHWLKDHEDCTRASAAAIIKSGLPFPNFGTEEVARAASGVVASRRIKTVDMWFGGTRLVIPAAVAHNSGGYAKTHPRNFEGMRGSLPNFYPPGPPADEIDRMGSMVEVRFKCSMDPKYMASWGKGYQSNADGIAKVKAKYEADAAATDPQRSAPSRISVNRRDDIGMTEVLYERGRGTYNDGMPMWEASYWPLTGELKGPDGSVSGIGCKTRHDPVERRYGGTGWRCTAGLSLLPQGSAQIEIYVAHIQHMPAVFEQVKQVLVNAQQPPKE